ncbi:nephrin-like [Penaeus monodon]|uniref:nephrin-like n=1 Tax=Penaeus monodon TaxID=6687 RepID=UPI0018A6DD70|nr:nephrin-like [Penaeus monodon]
MASRGDSANSSQLSPASSQDAGGASPGGSVPLEVSVVVSVLYPPSRPAITGYDEGHALSEGDTLNLTCAVGAANPRPRLSWHKNGLRISPKDTTEEVVLNAPSTGLSLTQAVTATRQEDGAVYECRVNTSLFSRPLASDVTLSVQYPPSNVTMTGPQVVGSGNSVTFTCVTSPANPPANVTWTIHGSLNKKSKSAVSRGPEGGWVTTSTLTYRVARSSNELVVRCMARNAASSSPVTTSKSVQVIKTPKPPVVEADMKGTVVAGTVLDLTCTTHGGHPPRQVKMFKGEEQMDIEVEEDENVTVAHTAITVEPSDNKAKILCEVQNPASQEPLTGHTTISLFFPAWEVKGWVSPRSVEVKEEVTLGCETSPSIPPSTVTWHSGGATLEGATTRQYPGKYGGTVTSSELRVRPLADDNGRVFSCNANNGLGVTVSADLVIDVLHGPRWVEVPSPVLDVEEGRDIIISAIAMANPPPVRYNWRRGEVDLLSTGISGGELRLYSISRSHSANYTVTATSARGSESYAFFINVLCFVYHESIEIDSELCWINMQENPNRVIYKLINGIMIAKKIKNPIFRDNLHLRVVQSSSPSTTLRMNRNLVRNKINKIKKYKSPSFEPRRAFRVLSVFEYLLIPGYVFPTFPVHSYGTFTLILCWKKAKGDINNC